MANKKTFLLIKALELANWAQANELNDWLDPGNPGSDEKVEAITQLYNDLKVRQYAEREMETHAEKAFKALDEISLPAPHKQYLKDFADGLLVREN